MEVLRRGLKGKAKIYKKKKRRGKVGRGCKRQRAELKLKQAERGQSSCTVVNVTVGQEPSKV